MNYDEKDMYPLMEFQQIMESLPQCQALGIKMAKFTRGHCETYLEYDEKLAGDPDTGIIHGGVVTTLMDTAGGASAFSVIKAGQTVATLDLRIDYLKPAEPGARLHGVTECYKLTKNVAFVRGYAYNTDRNDPIANCTATFMVGSVGFSPETGKGEKSA